MMLRTIILVLAIATVNTAHAGLFDFLYRRETDDHLEAGSKDKDVVNANYFEIALMAADRAANEGGPIDPDASLMALGKAGQQDMSAVCGRGAKAKPRNATTVTHYYVPLLRNFQSSACHDVEGVCRFWKNGAEYLANYGRPTVRLSSAFCKNGIGYGLNENCTHPCRSLAASTSHHRPGEVIFFPELVGKKCGSGKNQMIHDGFMIVNDTGARKHFNREGRFDFFWGECRDFRGGVCHDAGAEDVTRVLTKSRFCRAWRPEDPGFNERIKVTFQNSVRTEAVAHGDPLAAGVFDLDVWTESSLSKTGSRLARLAQAARDPGLSRVATASRP